MVTVVMGLNWGLKSWSSRAGDLDGAGGAAVKTSLSRAGDLDGSRVGKTDAFKRCVPNVGCDCVAKTFRAPAVGGTRSPPTFVCDLLTGCVNAM